MDIIALGVANKANKTAKSMIAGIDPNSWHEEKKDTTVDLVGETTDGREVRLSFGKPSDGEKGDDGVGISNVYTEEDSQGIKIMVEYSDGRISHAGYLPEPINSFTSIKQRAKYLYEIQFDHIPPAEGNAPLNFGGCSTFLKSGKVYRNLDFNYTENASFIVQTPNFKGMAFIDGLKDGQFPEWDLQKVRQLPNRVVDGINESGLIVSTHLVFNDSLYTSYEGDDSIPIYQIPSLLLNNCNKLSDIGAWITSNASKISIPQPMQDNQYTLIFFIKIGNYTYSLQPIDGQYALFDLSTQTIPKLTNFVSLGTDTIEKTTEGLQDRPTGLERYNLINSGAMLEDLRFTKCYESADRLSEFIGEDGTTKLSTDQELIEIYNKAKAIYDDRRRDGQTWHTMHSVIYDPSNNSMAINVQENWDDTYNMPEKTSGGTSDYNDLSNKPQINLVELTGDISSEDLGLQSKLTAGTNITISENNVISASGGGAVSSVNGQTGAVVLDADDILVENTQSVQANLERIDDELGRLEDDKQDNLTAGANISILNGTISATDTTYTAGTNITISENNVISASGGGSSDYNDLSNKPQINGIELNGDKSIADLDMVSSAPNNALSQGEDGGLYVEDKTNDIARVETKTDRLNIAQKTVNKSLGYFFATYGTDGDETNHSITVTAKTNLVPNLTNRKLNEIEVSADGWATLLGGHSYRISANVLASSAGQGRIYIVDKLGKMYHKFGYWNGKTVTPNDTPAIVYMTPDEDIEVGFCVTLESGSTLLATFCSFEVQEIGRNITIDPVEHVNESTGIEDTPVGHILAYMGTDAPSHYLVADGSIYNIADYPYLAQWMIDNYETVNHFGGDGVTTFGIPDWTDKFADDTLYCIKYEPTYFMQTTYAGGWNGELTEEHWTGEYYKGKPVYEIVLSGTASSSQDTPIDVSSLRIERILALDGVLNIGRQVTDASIIGIPMFNSASDRTLWYMIPSTNTLYIRIDGTARREQPYDITLKYTKSN